MCMKYPGRTEGGIGFPELELVLVSYLTPMGAVN